MREAVARLGGLAAGRGSCRARYALQLAGLAAYRRPARGHRHPPAPSRAARASSGRWSSRRRRPDGAAVAAAAADRSDRHWRLPVVLCARTALGTINHTLLSLEALRRRRVPVHRRRLHRRSRAEVEATIVDARAACGGSGGCRMLDPLDAGTLAQRIRGRLRRRAISANKLADDRRTPPVIAGLASVHAACAAGRGAGDRARRGRVARDAPTAGASSMRSRRGG